MESNPVFEQAVALVRQAMQTQDPQRRLELMETALGLNRVSRGLSNIPGGWPVRGIAPGAED